jgi:beta-glucosidase
MRHIPTVLGALFGAALLLAGPALAAPGCPAIPARSPMPREAVPAPLEAPEWRGRVAELDQGLARINRNAAEIVFLGDSITQSWEPTMFGQFFGHRRALNLGVSGDATQGLLWRLQAGQWGTMRPPLAVLMIGTNNAGNGSRAEDIALGIAEVIRFIHGRSPQTRVLLLGVLPRGADRSDPLRAVNARVNELVARCADGRATIFVDAGPLMVSGDGRLSEHVAFDRLHLTMVGYAILGAAIAPTVRAALGN